MKKNKYLLFALILLLAVAGIFVYKTFNKKDILDESEQSSQKFVVEYDYYYQESESYYIPNDSDKAVKGIFYNKLYILKNNTYYMVHNNLSENSVEYDYGTYTKEGSKLKLSNTKTYTTNRYCYYDDGPYEYTFDLNTLQYSDSAGYVNIYFSKKNVNDDITKVLPNYDFRCTEISTD